MRKMRVALQAEDAQYDFRDCTEAMEYKGLQPKKLLLSKSALRWC
jgi:hypothetical protein